MPLIHSNKQKLSQEDTQALQDLLRGNLQNIASRFEYYKTYTANNGGARTEEVYGPIIKAYQEEIERLPEKIRAAQNRRDDVTAADFIENIHNNLAEKVFSTLDPEDDLYPDIQNILFSEMGGSVYPDRLFGMQPEERDMPEKYQEQVDEFKLADVPFEGVEDIAEYNPNSDSVMVLYENRSGNSTTLSAGRIEQLEKRVETSKDRQAYEKNLKDLQDAKRGAFGLHAGAEYSRIRSSEMMAKENVSFADVYDTFININKMARPGDPDGGKLRGTGITAGNLKGPGATVIPGQTYQTLQTIAENINRIKQTQNPALQKTQAIQLAAFAYQMTLAQHVFSDGNGRTCRLFADSILQTFGLPPHTPTKAESDIMKTIGEEKMSFHDGAKVFLENVKKSDLELKKDPEITKQRLRQEPPAKKKGGIQEETSLKFSALYEVNDETVATLDRLKQSTKKASGRFRDSDEYKDFRKAVNDCCRLAKKLNESGGSKNFNRKQAEAEYASSVRKLYKTAADYKTYKLKDHTEDPVVNPGKKSLNSKDREKMGVINEVLENKELIKVKKPEANPTL